MLRKHLLTLATAIVASAAFAIFAPTANATTYQFTFAYSGSAVGGGAVSGSGTLYGTETSVGQFLLTSGSGSSSEAGALTLEVAGTYINTLAPSVNLISDNVLYSPGNPALTSNGIVFLGAALPSNSQYFNIWGNGPGNYTYFNNYAGPFPAVNGTLDSFTVTEIGPVATPLPSTWTMLIAGFLGLGFLAYNGTKKSAVDFASI
jgi:hypothetical protein